MSVFFVSGSSRIQTHVLVITLWTCYRHSTATCVLFPVRLPFKRLWLHNVSYIVQILTEIERKHNLPSYYIIMYTVNIEIFMQHIFSRILRSAVDAQKYGVSEN